MRAKSFTPRRSRTSVRFKLPAPQHSGHSMVSFTSTLCPMSMYTGDSEKSSGCWAEIFGNKHSAFWTIFPKRPYTKSRGTEPDDPPTNSAAAAAIVLNEPGGAFRSRLTDFR